MFVKNCLIIIGLSYEPANDIVNERQEIGIDGRDSYRRLCDSGVRVDVLVARLVAFAAIGDIHVETGRRRQRKRKRNM